MRENWGLATYTAAMTPPRVQMSVARACKPLACG